MSEEVIESVPNDPDLHSPIQDALEAVYTQLGIALDKRAFAANRRGAYDLPMDYGHDIVSLSEAIKNLGSVYNW
jgi:hypothetical protein